MIDYDAQDMTALASLVRAGRIAPEDLLNHALARAGAVQPRLNALAHLDAEGARARIVEGLPEGPFTGVPFLLKDTGCETPDLPVTSGSRIAPPRRYPEDSAIYARLKSAGLVAFGRTTTPEFGVGPVTEAAVYGGPTRNPWNTDHTPGGSSGGSGAAVAAGVVPGAHGSDGGGSTRMPASCCGLFSLKPSRALIPDGPYVGEGWAGMAIECFLTRSVRDTAALLDATAGADLGAPYHPPPIGGTFLSSLDGSPGRMRVALCPTRFDGVDVHPECARAVELAGDLLSRLGHEIVEARPGADVPGMMRAWTRIVACGTHSWVRGVEAARGQGLRDRIETVAQGACAYAETLSGADYLDAVSDIHDFGREMAGFFETGGFDVLVSPVLAEPPARIGRFAHSRPEFADFEAYRMGPGGVFDYSPFAPAFNASGQPAVSVPLHWSADGLPIGVQMAAPMGRDRALLALSAQLEAARPWFDRRPPGA